MSMGEDRKRKSGKLSESYVAGIIALVFLILGFQVAVFIHKAAVAEIVANRDAPDTVYVHSSPVSPVSAGADFSVPPGQASGQTSVAVRKNAGHVAVAEAVRANVPRKRVETFAFNPNTVAKDDLCRLGFSSKQAQSIVNYRLKGGYFRRKSDFAASYVVSDSIYRRLEPYIDIPLTDLNKADSAEFDRLPGIGGWFASKIVAYRSALGGYSFKEQLMDIPKFNEDRYHALEDLVTVSADYISPYPLWTYPEDSLMRHPYIANRETARSIVLFRENNPKASWCVDSLASAGILSASQSSRLSRCAIALPD